MKKRTTARNKATNNDTYCRECLCFAPSLFVLRSFFFFFLFFSSLKDKSCLRRLSGYHVLPYTINQPLLEHITRITQLYFSSKAYLMFRSQSKICYARRVLFALVSISRICSLESGRRQYFLIFLVTFFILLLTKYHHANESDKGGATAVIK